MFNHLSGKQVLFSLLQPFYRHLLPANQAKDTFFVPVFLILLILRRLASDFEGKSEPFLTLTLPLRLCGFKSNLYLLFSSFICDYLSLDAEKILMAPDSLKSETSWKLIKSTKIP